MTHGQVQLQKLIKAATVFILRDPALLGLQGEHDILYVGADSPKLTKSDIKQLEDLGFYKQHDSWVMNCSA